MRCVLGASILGFVFDGLFWAPASQSRPWLHPMIRRRLMVAWLLLAAGTEALRAPMHHPSPHRGSRRASAPVSAIWDRLRRTTPEGATEETAEEQSSEPRADGPTLLADEKAYSAKIAEAEAGNRVVVIKFYASWCRACKAMAPKFSRVAQDWPELEFCEILFDDNKALCKQLGIKVLPYIEVRLPHAGMALPARPTVGARRLVLLFCPSWPHGAVLHLTPPPLCGPDRGWERGQGGRLLVRAQQDLQAD